jgi:hypothetical protein
MNSGIQARHFVDTTGTFGLSTDEVWLKGLDVRLSHLSPNRIAFRIGLDGASQSTFTRPLKPLGHSSTKRCYLT